MTLEAIKRSTRSTFLWRNDFFEDRAAHALGGVDYLLSEAADDIDIYHPDGSVHVGYDQLNVAGAHARSIATQNPLDDTMARWDARWNASPEVSSGGGPCAL